MFATSAEAKKAGWFSRRHQTREAHDASRETRDHRRKQRQLEAQVRQDLRDGRTPEEQLEVLRKRGVIKGVEVIRLKAQIEKVKGFQ